VDKALLFNALWVIVILVLLYRVVRWVLGQRTSPQRQQRHGAIGALCDKRGLVPGDIRMTTDFAIANMLRSSVNTSSFENSFVSPDGAVSAADFWRSNDQKTWHAFSLLVFNVVGLNLPYVAVTRRDMPGLPLVWGPQQVGLESIEFNAKFVVRAGDRRSAVMLLDEGMMQWILDCDQVSFEIDGDSVAALVSRTAEPTDQPGLGSRWVIRGHSSAPFSNPRQAEPVELKLLFKFWDGFVPRLPAILRTEYAAPR
jgi:hypothetical protein